MTTDIISDPVRARCGNSRRASSLLSSPPGRGRAESQPAELRLFLSKLFHPKEKIFFYPVMANQMADRCRADPPAMATLRQRRLVTDHFDRQTCDIVYRPLRKPNPISTSLSSRQFNSTVARVLKVNALGYEIFVPNNPLAFGLRCDKTVRGARNVVLENGGKHNSQWLDWLARNRRYALTAVDSGGVLQICISIQPIRNERCINRWEYLPDVDEGDDTTVELPGFVDVANQVEQLAKRDGLHPNHKALHDFSGLIWCPGFTNWQTNLPCRLLHPTLAVADAVTNLPTDAPIVPPVIAPVPACGLTPATTKTTQHSVRTRKRSRIAPPLLGQLQESDANIQFYVKVDAAEVLSPAFRKYADQANYIQHRILMGRMLGDLAGDFTLLKSDYLRQVIYAELLTPLLKEMQAVGLIERDDYYIVDQKSYGYRIADQYSDAKTIRVECRRPKLSHRICRLRHDDFRHYKAVHKHLFRWLSRLDIDRLLATKIIDQTDFNDAKLPIDEIRDIHHLAVQVIIDGHLEFKVCDYGRVHTIVTRLLKLIRNELRIDGQQLVTIDIANSQPLFLLAAMLTADDSVDCGENDASKGAFWCRKALLPPSASYTTSIYSEQTQNEAVATMSLYPEDLRHYRTLCETGRLYQYLMDRMGWTTGKQAFKDQELFRCLYGTNGSRDTDGNHNPSRLQPVLEADFPTVWGFITDWKRRHGYRDLACQMQRAESKLMIEGVCGRLMREHPDCPLVTIHDSIMTPQEWVEIVRATISDEFSRIEIRPTLHIERSAQLHSVGAAATAAAA